jgi:hypothetical protein
VSAVLGAVLVEIVLPIAAYLALVGLGVPPVWALAASAGVSVVVLVARWVRSRRISALGALVLVRFALGIAVALVTGDARFVLLKDYLVTLVIALAAGGTLRLERPFIAWIRRDLAPDRERFEARWRDDPAFRRVHRQLTRWWVGGLVGEVAVAVVLIYGLPLTAAVVATGVLTPAVLLGLIAVTQTRAGRVERRPGPPPAARPRAAGGLP